jgi:hypothetical protein
MLIFFAFAIAQIYRLITRNSYEREMFDKASMKLGLDKAILQKMPGDLVDDVMPEMSRFEIEELLKKGAYGAVMDGDDAGNKFCEEDIDSILERRTTVIIHDNTQEKGSVFSRAAFVSSESSKSPSPFPPPICFSLCFC